MSRRVVSLLATLAVATVITTPSWAKGNPSVQGTFILRSNTNVGDKTLVPGEYKVVEQDNQAKFEHDGKVVAEVSCTTKTLSSKAANTEAILDGNKLTEIQISGKMEAIEFSSNGSSGN